MRNTLEERDYQILLYDIYGGLLTEKQQNVFDFYYQDDYSLSEIADELGISRQGVHDNIKRSIKILEEYEEKLHLAQKELEKRTLIKKAIRILNENGNQSEIIEILKQM